MSGAAHSPAHSCPSCSWLVVEQLFYGPWRSLDALRYGVVAYPNSGGHRDFASLRADTLVQFRARRPFECDGAMIVPGSAGWTRLQIVGGDDFAALANSCTYVKQ